MAVELKRSARIGREATLSCEMSLYIRNDSDFQWRFGDQIITDSKKYGIAYTNSRERDSQKVRAQSNRLSTLTIFSMEVSDEGNYTCFVSGTEESATIQLTVDHSPEPTTVPTSKSKYGTLPL